MDEDIPTTTCTYRSHEFTIPASLDDCDRAIIEPFRTGDMSKVVDLLVGDQLPYLEAKLGRRLRVGEMRDLHNDLGVAMGWRSAGE